MRNLDDANVFEHGVRMRVMKVVHRESVSLHSHSFYELVYMQSGFSMYTLDRHNCILTAGDVFAVAPSSAHSYRNPFNAVLYNCVFHPESLGEEVLALLRGPLGKLFGGQAVPGGRMHLSPAQQGEAARLLSRMERECGARGYAWSLHVKGYLLVLLAMLSRALEADAEGAQVQLSAPPSLVYGAMAHIDANYAVPLRLGDLAELAGVSPDYFSRCFRAHVGLGPLEYLRVKRMEKACALLEGTRLAVTEIARQVGIEDNNYFARVFKQVVGSTPHAYREHMSEM